MLNYVRVVYDGWALVHLIWVVFALELLQFYMLQLGLSFYRVLNLPVNR